MHDGAAIISHNYRVNYVSALVNLSKKDNCNNLGTRHIAASSITERSDTLAILVSENKGEIKLFRDKTVTQLVINKPNQLVDFIQK